MQKLNGFIMLHRKILDWEWYEDANVMRVFVHLLLLASFKKTRWQGIEVLPGQVITSYAHLADKLHLSAWQIRTAFQKLQSTGEITVQSTTKYTLVTIEKWAFYQSANEKTTNESTTNLQRTNNESQHRNNVNNVNKVNKYTPAQTKVKADAAKPSIYGTGKYDYEQIRLKARERIRQRLRDTEESA